jgi:hypothetical protein
MKKNMHIVYGHTGICMCICRETPTALRDLVCCGVFGVPLREKSFKNAAVDF